MQIDPFSEGLDWLLTSTHWTIFYSETTIKPLGKLASGHIPCLVTIETLIPQSKKTFLIIWDSSPGFMDVLFAALNKPTRSNNCATFPIKNNQNA